MFPDLPPLNALRAFEAAARLQSMTLASKELHVTHGAISKQIKILEDYLGFALFVRLHKRVGLTDEAKRYLPHVQAALQTLSSATGDLRRQSAVPQSLAINVLPSLTINWLIPRMEQFKSRHPHLYVDLSIGDFAVDFSQGRYDIAIRSSTVIPKGVNYIKLMDEDLCLVCAPSLAPKLQCIEDINSVTLLKHTTRPELWEYWAEKVGLKLTQEQTFGVEHFYMLSQAAASGMGAALIPRFFIEDQLANGSLVIPFDANFISPYAYYLLTPKSPSMPLKVQAFIDWLLEIFAPYRH
ncbi:LysR substrate-binding domain-containing protein [Shewanella sp. CG12_big_fil_rev_8_21_14_0_65_47_15]|uniref:LysR substrate-binding domain-containing protein n=1 Tax=Shewanella sp. CG12_big_fil_rev_8_21_14_0_65_47_15 TaxID=1975537 RepID=UPI000CC7132A|nr:LysR substrate-binding domain-containing protein [Shewanella sp. CG12_big_fil_rev_8_21_14_0_65_47_15]PIW61199.1 MAG: LysR family transcriptional regulator [Shewanella sp. CG12_big_fil_rev_8_21_14_0_65_47_15]